MTKSYNELREQSSLFIQFLNNKQINAQVDDSSYRDYNVRIRNIFGTSVILYHKPSKKTFSIGTHEIKNEEIKRQIEDLWFQYNHPNEINIEGLCAYVDGSYYNNKIGWGVAIVRDNVVIEELSGLVNLSAEEGARQIAGEIYAVLASLDYAQTNNITSITIFYDYIGLQKWACGEWKASSQIAQFYVGKMLQNRIRITWKKVKAHTGNRFNELADQLAKKHCITNN